MKSLLLYIVLFASFSIIFSSCKKDKDPVDQTPIVPPTLFVGRAATSFTTSADFAGGTTFSSSNAPSSSATSAISGTTRTIILNTKNNIGDNQYNINVVMDAEFSNVYQVQRDNRPQESELLAYGRFEAGSY